MADDKVKPLLKEYTDASHLLVPNQWYEIRIRVEKGITTYSVNDEELFRYTLAGGEGDGHFGLRLCRITYSLQILKRLYFDLYTET